MFTCGWCCIEMSSQCGKTFLCVFVLIVFAIDSSKSMEKSKDTLEKEILTECLMGLKMSELLRLQRSLERISELEDAEQIESKESTITLNETAECNAAKPNDNGTCVSPQALALTAEKRGYEHHPWQPEEKPSKLQTLFHISITALSFLSFGGYLLCLIVQAIKSKGTTYIHPDATTALSNGNGGVKRIKIYRRSRRELLPKQALVPSKPYQNANNPYRAYH